MEKITGKWTCASRNWKAKLAISIVCVVNCTWHIGFYEGCPWENHLIYSFFHANGFHLAINLIVLWSIKNKLRPVTALIVAIVASYLPMYTSEPTMGLSGFLFSCFGLMWGKTGRLWDAIKKAMPFILLTMIMSNVNGLLHLYCFWLGYSVGFLRKMFLHRF